MLLYNNKQEFIGIDDEGLRLLNYGTMEELLNVCSDVADLFANEPGYIHNFKNFGWIDFLLHAESDASSAIVHANGRTFSCRLTVSSFHLCSHPAQNSYSIEMSQIKNISGEEFKPHTITPKASSHKYAPTIEQTTPSPALPDYSNLTPTQLNEPSTFDIPVTHATSLDQSDDIYASLMAPLSDKELDTSSDEKVTQASSNGTFEKTQYANNEQEYLSQHKTPSDYLYNPSLAANELGLPVDLIEEFIGDFIQQSHDFKNDLFSASAQGDNNTLHILSHKLKGVAANLRVENALECLSVINASSDSVEIEANLKYFYEIIAKLEGKEVSGSTETITAAPKQEVENKPTEAISLEALDDIYAFTLKQNEDETLLIDDNEIHDVSTESEEVTIPFKKEFFELSDETEDETVQIETPKVESPAVDETQKPAAPVLHYDVKDVAGTLGIEVSFMEELLHEYKNDASSMNATIIKAIKSFDTHTWRSSAAKLKGISDNLRLSEISDELAILSITNDAQEAKKSFLRLTGYLDQL